METERRDVRGQDGGRLCGEDKYKYMRLVHAACGEIRLWSIIGWPKNILISTTGK